MKQSEQNEAGYILILVLVIVCVITLAIIGMTTRTTQASFFAAKRAGTVQVFSLAESAALEGFWYLKNDPNYRVINQERQWGSTRYRFSIIDSSPLDDPNSDTSLEIFGEGFAGSQRRSVRLVLSRPDLSSSFEISLWREEN